jgi:hypothetical protein
LLPAASFFNSVAGGIVGADSVAGGIVGVDSDALATGATDEALTEGDDTAAGVDDETLG